MATTSSTVTHRYSLIVAALGAVVNLGGVLAVRSGRTNGVDLVDEAAGTHQR